MFILTLSCSTLKFNADLVVPKQVSRVVLDDGMTVIVNENHSADIVVLDLFIKVGSINEDEKNNGITHFVQKVLLKGTKNRTALQIAKEVESIGARINVNTAQDYTEIYIQSLNKHFDIGLDILSDIVMNPVFDQKEVEKERNIIMSEIELQEDRTFNYVYNIFLETTYPNHPYRFLTIGNKDSIKDLTAEMLKEHYQKYYLPENMILCISGKIDAKEVISKVTTVFSKFKSEELLAERDKVKISKINQNKKNYVKKEIEQAFVILGFTAPEVDNSDYTAMKVINSVLGVGMSSRLFRKLRDSEGLAYSVGSFYPTRLDSSRLVVYIGTDKEKVAESIERILGEISELKTVLIPKEELERAKKYLKGNFALEHQTNKSQAWYLGFYEILGKGFDYDKMYPLEIEQVTEKDVKKVANKYFDNYTLVVVEPE